MLLVPLVKVELHWLGLEAQGVYLKKKLTGGLCLFFGSEIFDILIILGLEKSLLLFGSEDFSPIFWG